MGNSSRSNVQATMCAAPVMTWGRFTTNGSSAVSASTIKGNIATVTRTDVGTYTLTFREGFTRLLGIRGGEIVGSAGRTLHFTAIDVAAKTATVEIRGPGSAAAWTAELVVASNTVELAAAGSVVDVTVITSDIPSKVPAWSSALTVTANAYAHTRAATVVAVQAVTSDIPSAIPAWSAALAVTTDVLVMSRPGWIVAAHGVAGGTAGPKQMIYSGVPATGEVLVEYDAAGIATLTFNDGTDDITSARVMVIDASLGALKVIHTGTAGPGEVKVTYASGVPTLTFAAGDAVTAARAQFIDTSTGALKTIYTGTPGPGEVLVEYTDGVATLTFAAGDNVSAARASIAQAGVVQDATSDVVRLELLMEASALPELPR
jgi:hypothetical protein